MPKFKNWSPVDSAKGKTDPSGGTIKKQWENDDRMAQVVITERSDGRWNRIIRDERISGGSRVKDFRTREQAVDSGKRYIKKYP